MKEIREMTGQENGQISPYLKMMTDQKIVERMAKKTARGEIPDNRSVVPLVVES